MLTPAAAVRLGGRPPAAAAGQRHRLHADGRRRRAARDRRSRPCTATRSRWRPTPAGSTRTTRERLEDDLRGQPAQGAGRDLGAGHGLRQARPRLRRPRRLTAVAGLLLPAGRPRRARRSTTPRSCCCRPRPTRGCGTTSPRPPSPTRTRSNACSSRLERHEDERSPACPRLEAVSGLRRTQGRADAQAAGRRRGGRAGRGRVAADRRALVVRRRALRRHRRDPTSRGRHHARATVAASAA